MDKDVRNELDEIKLMIRGLHALLQNTTPRTTPNFRGIEPLKSIHKQAIKRINKAQIMKAIKHYIEENYRTTEIKDEIILRFGISPSCFYNYYKSLHALLQNTTPRFTP